jgi:hypothetical protein
VFFRIKITIPLLALVVLAGNWPVLAKEIQPPSLHEQPAFRSPDQVPIVRRVNAPYFSEDEVRFAETAIFWFGQVTPTSNYVDVRVGYNDRYLFVHLTVFDRRLWYDASPSASDLTAWDSASLYLDLDGSTGNAPDNKSYRFDSQLDWWEPREDYEAAYQGRDNSWAGADVSFSTESEWFSEGALNENEMDDRGWRLGYYVRFSNLGLSGPPPPGTVWGLALTLHDRDDVAGDSIEDQNWPEAMEPSQPVTWGQLRFGLPGYTAPVAAPGGITIVQQGLDGAVVVDGDVGGSSVCGDPLKPDYFSAWGDLNYSGKIFSNVQNQRNVADWPCFSKYYVTFPLSSLPAGSSVLSATLTLHQVGGAGEGWSPEPQPSLIQVLTVGEDWDESSLTWNNAPLAVENVSNAWIDPIIPAPGWPGVPRQWDVSQAVADAQAAGQPVRLALYEADSAYHSGKYFATSDTDEWGRQARPALTVKWGRPLARLDKTAAPSSGHQSDSIVYTLSFLATGGPLSLSDQLPSGVGAPHSFELEGTAVSPAYNSGQHRLTWNDAPSADQKVVIRYVVTITTNVGKTLANTATLQDGSDTSTDVAVVIANPHAAYLPLIDKNR